MQELDRDVVEWLSSLHWPLVTPAMKGLTYAGAGGTIWIVIGLVVAFRQRRPLVLVAVVGMIIVTSRFGLRLMTIREDEVAAEAMGIDTFRYKIYAFLLSAAAPGIVGGLAARDMGYIEPISVFPLVTTITMIVMVLFGGKGTIWGPVLGAVILFTFQELVWANFPHAHQILLGGIIVAVVLVMPRGILGVLQQRYNLPRTV